MITRRTFGGLTAVLAASRGRAKASQTVTVLAPGRRVNDKVAELARSLGTANLNVTAAPGYGPVQNVARLLGRRDEQVAVCQQMCWITCIASSCSRVRQSRCGTSLSCIA